MRIKAHDCTDKIKINSMCKQYENGFVAIKDITFGSNAGEIFGLLGPYIIFYLFQLNKYYFIRNGAGKSTTFNILSI